VLRPVVIRRGRRLRLQNDARREFIPPFLIRPPLYPLVL